MESPDLPSTAPLADRLAAAAALMESVIEDRALLVDIEEELRKRFLIAAGRVSHPDSDAKRRLVRAGRKKAHHARKDRDQLLLERTEIRVLRANPIFRTPRHQAQQAGASPPLGEVEKERICYVCRVKFTKVHFFYDQMCLECGDFNHAKRSQTADLTGRVALVTGSRVKIGFQAAIMLLRAGCRVICTTRFPKDAARRYAAEADFADWGSRLEVHGLDLRNPIRVEELCQTLLQTHTRLDFIINNACQTVRRPPGFYDHLLAGEEGQTLTAEAGRVLAIPTTALSTPGGPPSLTSAEMTQLELLEEDSQGGELLFPTGRLDADLQQVDLREVNSWRLRAHEVPTVELLEVHLVNAVAPYILNTRLKPLLLAVSSMDKHVVNVSAVEGQFYRILKSDKHPHTNMAKASLNMLTRTAALDYIKDGIHMNSVDTGWVTDEDPVHHAERKREQHGFHPPLDIVDGAARIVDPIFSGLLTGEHVWGQFLKDYRETDW
ncbi:MAG: SDR family oxidoreductase [Planctomycetes bacterium]|nr:SDR family oxidoreductase [Planctomycetota bacterium]